jgi:hypothetical protein
MEETPVICGGKKFSMSSVGDVFTIKAIPERVDEKTNCHKVTKRVWKDGSLIRETVEEICEDSDRHYPPPYIVYRYTPEFYFRYGYYPRPYYGFRDYHPDLYRRHHRYYW